MKNLHITRPKSSLCAALLTPHRGPIVPRSLGRLLLGAFITASLSACIDIGPHAPLGPSLISGTVSPTCRPGTPLPPGRLFTDITEQAGLKGITGVRVAAADA